MIVHLIFLNSILSFCAAFVRHLSRMISVLHIVIGQVGTPSYLGGGSRFITETVFNPISVYRSSSDLDPLHFCIGEGKRSDFCFFGVLERKFTLSCDSLQN